MTRGQGEVGLAIKGKTAMVQVAVAGAYGKLIRSRGRLAAFTAKPTIRQMAW